MTPIPASDDADLVRACLAGNREAFGQIVSRYQSLVCSLAYSATGSLTQSEDLAQETFFTAWKQLAELREPPKVRAWLCGIARNLINNSRRAHGREPSHRAEPLEAVGETHSPEPLPVERVIRGEEAQILWRSLERIPETYREPLVLFYREQQSIETVAGHLDLTEETVRQRLSRGRKLLQAEVLAFVESTLAKTAPGPAFTLSVTGSLPVAAAATKAMSAGLGAAKTGVGVKGLLSLGPMAGFVGMLGTIFYSWKLLVDDSKSPRERQFTRRVAKIQIAVFLGLLAVATFLAPILFAHHPVIFGIAYAVLILLCAVNASVGTLHLVRRRLEIQAEDGTFPSADGSGAKASQKVFQRTNRITLIWLLIFALGCLGFPWRYHPSRCAFCVAVGCLLFAWSSWRRQQMQKSPAQVRLWLYRFPLFSRNPGVAALVTMFGVTLLCGVGCLGFSALLYPEAWGAGMFGHLGLGLGVGLLAVALIAALAFAGRKLGFGSSGFIASALQRLVSVPADVGGITEKGYGLGFDQLHLSPDRRARLKGLILDKTMAGARFGMSFTKQKPDATQRTALIETMQSEMAKYEGQLRELLGADDYQTFRNYEKTVPERMLISQFASRHAGTALAPSVAQQEMLCRQINAARTQYAWTTPLGRRDQTFAEYLLGLNHDAINETINAIADEEGKFGRQILAEAGAILNPEQATAFEQFWSSQQQSQVNQMRLAARLFVPGVA